MKRGPYKSYLRPDSDGIMPRSTFYGKLKKYQCDVSINLFYGKHFYDIEVQKFYNLNEFT